MSSSNNGVYPLSLYLSSLSGNQDIIPNAYNHFHQSPGQMASAVPGSLLNYMEFNSDNQQGFRLPKKPVKKDRHSKIHTAQGLRDRRVRLSIGIARQFFDLQDMLGFDKASKTLDWLLNKSRKAINKVVQAKKPNNDDENFGNDGGNEDEEEEDGEEEEEEEEEDGNKGFVYGYSPKYYEEEAVCQVMNKEKRKKKRELSNISSNGSRAKVKGKAKEQTKEMTYDRSETVSDITQSEIPDPFQRSIIFNDGQDMTHSSYKDAIFEEFNNQESILSKRKINLPTNMGQNYNQQNGIFMLMDQGSSSNYNTILPHNVDYNYDKTPFFDQPYCGVTHTNFHKGLP